MGVSLGFKQKIRICILHFSRLEKFILRSCWPQGPKCQVQVNDHIGIPPSGKDYQAGEATTIC